MDELKVLEAFIQIIEIAHQISRLAWKRMAPSAIRSYAEEILQQVEILEKEAEHK